MSNTEKMISVPREWLYSVSLLHMTLDELQDQAAEFLCQPADQPQGEPVVLPIRHEDRCDSSEHEAYQNGWNACLDEIAMLGPLYTRPEQGEPVAWVEADDLRRIAEGALLGGTVWGRQSKAPFLPRVPVFGRVDPGEVERLRALATALAGGDIADLGETRSANAELAGEVDTLRAELSKAINMLKIRAEQNEEFGRLIEEQHAQLAKCHALLQDVRTDHVTGPRVGHKWFERRDAALSDSAEPSVPVERDERTDFESSHVELFGCPPRTDDQQPDFALTHYNRWLLWQARAALDRKP